MPDEQNDARSDTGVPGGTPTDKQENKTDVQTDIDNFDKGSKPADAGSEHAQGTESVTSRPVRRMSASDFKIPKAEPRPAEPETPKVSPTELVKQQSAPVQAPEHIPEPARTEPVKPVHQEPPKAAPAPAYVPEIRPPVQTQEPRTEPKAPEAPHYTEPLRQEPTPPQGDHTPQEGQWDRYELRQPQPQQGQGYQPEYRGSNNASGGGFDGALKGIISFFTIFKLNVSENDIKATESRLYLAPIAGLIIGLIAAVVAAVVFKIGTPGFIWTSVGGATLYNPAVHLGIAATSLSIAAVFVLSKFLHFDGLADFGDGIVVSGDREKHIRALKDSRVGAGGVAFALIVTLVSFGFLSSIGGLFAVVAVIAVVEIFAKNAMVAAAAFGEPGNGMASEQVRQTNINSLLFSTVISVGLAFASLFVLGVISWGVLGANAFESHTLLSAAVAIAGSAGASVAAGFLMSQVANKNFGFVNGDVLGATNEVGRALALIVSFVVFYVVLL